MIDTHIGSPRGGSFLFQRSIEVLYVPLPALPRGPAPGRVYCTIDMSYRSAKVNRADMCREGAQPRERARTGMHAKRQNWVLSRGRRFTHLSVGERQEIHSPTVEDIFARSQLLQTIPSPTISLSPASRPPLNGSQHADAPAGRVESSGPVGGPDDGRKVQPNSRKRATQQPVGTGHDNSGWGQSIT